MNNFDPNTGETLNNNQISDTVVQNSNTNFNSQPQKRKSPVLKIILIILGIIIGIIVLVFVVFRLIMSSNDKLVCKSSVGNITIIYDDNTIIGYTATGSLTYNLDQQKSIAESIGTDAYMVQFENWFRTNTSGSCTYEKK